MSGFKPRPPVWQASALSIVRCPSGTFIAYSLLTNTNSGVTLEVRYFPGQYLNLDKDHNGMLSKAELLHYGTSTLTPAFVNRVFEVCLTYGGEMDYKTYLDFVLALENRKEPQVVPCF